MLTPTLTGAQPAIFKLNGKTIRPVGRESDKALALLKSLDKAQQKQAVLSYQVADLVLGPGQDGKKITPEGLKAQKMNAQQKAMLLDLIAEWSGILTMDNGSEFARNKLFGAALDADTFFAKPYHAWERGLNEHTNGLVREYFPKSTDFTAISDDEVLRVEELLNNRPRAVPAFRTPLEVFSNPQLLQPVALAI